ncbi:diacylglycerol kinase family lipid kinase, partial [bacterium]|nr:diacylglycerol kinase family lipid kinase [bacterium]
NPNAGPAINKIWFRQMIAQHTRRNPQLEAIQVTRTANETMRVAREAVERGYDPVVAVGGDGTINAVATGIYGSDARLAVVPTGSGNGLARHFKIPLSMGRALKVIDAGKALKIDVGWCEGRLFLVTCGIGLDAQVASVFEASKARGIVSYFRLAIAELHKFQPEEIFISHDGHLGEARNPLLVTAANLSQYGGRTIIAPDASATDGLLDVVVIEPVSVLRAISLVPRLVRGNLLRTPEVSIFRAPMVSIKRSAPGPFHVDGDPIAGPAEISIRVEPHAMKLIVP